MSKPAMPAPVMPPQPTRRQLDELEALLQRMLALPVQQPDNEGPTTNAEERSGTRVEALPAAWDETTMEEVAEGMPSHAFPEVSPNVSSEWEPPKTSAVVLPESTSLT